MFNSNTKPFQDILYIDLSVDKIPAIERNLKDYCHTLHVQKEFFEIMWTIIRKKPTIVFVHINTFDEKCRKIAEIMINRQAKLVFLVDKDSSTSIEELHNHCDDVLKIPTEFHQLNLLMNLYEMDLQFA
ncbi:hypothetical protein THMIRHAS_02770 [Thiosulfatimonas sediminis]|uniref:Uncharacterized protein n=1 Tax=Thiosulfatimonas sediminis TaxID=2675054 RepID=A0A6F8PS93_9GAMM|nr:hypothetical protein [Thiosulfatimonas sediminis]BBP44904.1 hypothetical protein THMIRHAS_02770 [Thiosulfatimonas sediminis]